MDGFIIMVSKGPWNLLRNRILPAKVRPKVSAGIEVDRIGGENYLKILCLPLRAWGL